MSSSSPLACHAGVVCPPEMGPEGLWGVWEKSLGKDRRCGNPLRGGKLHQGLMLEPGGMGSTCLPVGNWSGDFCFNLDYEVQIYSAQKLKMVLRKRYYVAGFESVSSTEIK